MRSEIGWKCGIGFRRGGDEQCGRTSQDKTEGKACRHPIAVQAGELGGAVKQVECSRGDEKPKSDASRSPQEQADRGPDVEAQAARADRDRSAEDPEGTLRALVADEGEGTLQCESGGQSSVG